jgi:CheY-specific phosphatase CheX
MPPELEPAYTIDRDPAAGDTARRVAAEVLETMFFTEAELADCEHAWMGEALCAHIHFDGSHTGEMLLAVSAEAADAIAASFLGMESSEPTDAESGQVIAELSNILCGAMLSQLWPESTLALTAPDLSQWQEWPAEGTLHRCFQILEGMVAFSIRLLACPDSPAADPADGL